jgi:hypothetical protein
MTRSASDAAIYRHHVPHKQPSIHAASLKKSFLSKQPSIHVASSRLAVGVDLGHDAQRIGQSHPSDVAENSLLSKNSLLSENSILSMSENSLLSKNSLLSISRPHE